MADASPTSQANAPLQVRLDLARVLADRAGAVIMDHFDHARARADDKADGSPVTAADRAAEACITAGIAKAFPDDGILGEEGGEVAGSTGLRWVIDPIDGTVSFMHGAPLFGTLIGIERDGTPVAGVMHFPVLSETAWAIEGGGAWHRIRDGEPRPARVSTCARLEQAMVCTTSFDYYRGRSIEDAYTAIGHACRRTRGWSDCHSQLLLATGRIDAVIEPELKPWDCSAIIAILHEAGGRYTDWRGERERDSSISLGIASNGHLHGDLVEALSGWAD